MRKMKIKPHHFKFWICLVPIIVFSISNIAFAASTGTSNLLRQIGSGAAPAGGDYISASIANVRIEPAYYVLSSKCRPESNRAHGLHF